MSRALAAGLVASALLLAARPYPVLAWLACAPLFALHGEGRLRDVARGVRLGAIAGMAFAASFAVVAHVPWLAAAGERYFALSPGGALAGSVALALGCGLVLGCVLGILLACAHTLPTPLAVAAYGAVWVACETSALMTFPSYPWLGLAATQTDLPAVVQSASVAGQAGVSLIVAGAGAALGVAVSRALQGRVAWAALGFAGALAGTVALAGSLRLREARPAGDASCTVAGADARLPSGAPSSAEAFDRHLAASEAALAIGPDVLVWPESALPSDPQLDGELLARLRALADRQDLILLVGAPRTAWSGSWQERRYNSLHRIAPGRGLETYDKRVLVPIAERWPWPWLRPPAALQVAEVAPGERPGLIDAGGCLLGVMICFEAERPELARELALAGADALVIASNDAPLAPRAIATELAQARLRAVETGLPVLRIANGGASVALDRYGRTLESGDGVVALDVSTSPRLAPATRWASRLVAACAVATACAVLSALALLVRRR